MKAIAISRRITKKASILIPGSKRNKFHNAKAFLQKYVKSGYSIENAFGRATPYAIAGLLGNKTRAKDVVKAARILKQKTINKKKKIS